MARRGPLTRAPGALKGGILLKLSTFLLQLKGDPLAKKQIFEKKVSQCRKTERALGKTERTLWDFSTSILSQNIKKMQGGPFGENFFFEKKVSQCRKNERGESLVSPSMVCYAEKQEKPFWFSSLDQIVHFDAIIFCRTILVSSCG